MRSMNVVNCEKLMKNKY